MLVLRRLSLKKNAKTTMSLAGKPALIIKTIQIDLIELQSRALLQAALICNKHVREAFGLRASGSPASL